MLFSESSHHQQVSVQVLKQLVVTAVAIIINSYYY